MTNKGLSIQLRLVPSDEGEGLYLAALDCERSHTFDSQLEIYLKRFTSKGDQFVRAFPRGIEKVEQTFLMKG
jgi:hypothetical protein